MYIVARLRLHRDKSFSDEWEAKESPDTAFDLYQRWLADAETSTVTMALSLQSSDYDSPTYLEKIYTQGICNEGPFGKEQAYKNSAYAYYNKISASWKKFKCKTDGHEAVGNDGHEWTIIPHEFLKDMFDSDCFEICELIDNSAGQFGESESVLLCWSDYNEGGVYVY